MSNAQRARRDQLLLEALEPRQMLSLLGVLPNPPEVNADVNGTLNYTASTKSFVSAATPTLVLFPDHSVKPVLKPSAFNLNIEVNNNGTLQGSGTATSDIEVDGTVNSTGDYGYFTGVLLTGTITQFGYQDEGGGVAEYDFRFTVTGGALDIPGLFAGQDIGMDITSEASTFQDLNPGDPGFTVNFSGQSKAVLGAIPELASPTITTTPSVSNVALGAAPVTLNDTALLTGGDNETGALTFTLIGPGNTTVDTETLAVNGDGSYTTPTGYTLPSSGTVAGTYQWDVTYSGDLNNKPASDNNATDEQVTVNQASATTVTAIDDAVSNGMPTGTLGESVYDTAAVNGGYITPSGTVTYNFYSTNSPIYGTTTPLSTQTVTLVNGLAPASAATAALAAGAYSYIAVYSGDGNYQGSISAVEPLTINKGTLSLLTTIDDAVSNGTPTGVAGESVYDTATVTGQVAGFAIGTISYTFQTGSGTPVAAGSGTTSNTEGPLATGSYNFQASVAGNSNYIGATSAVEPLTIQAAPITDSLDGTVYIDATGNGLSATEQPLAGDTPEAGVVVDLYKDVNGNGVLDSSDGAPIATYTTGANGQYSFTNLPLGAYIVAEVAPSGYIQTAPTIPDYYAETVVNGQEITNLNFANYHPCTTTLQCVTYTLSGGGCQTTTVTNLRGATAQGETVTVTFTVPSGSAAMQYTLVSYNAPDSYFNASDASEQTIYQEATGTFGPGTHTLTVTLPNNYYQVDFVCGAAITQLGPAGSNIFYSAQDRLISADNAGLHDDVDDESATMLFW
ncbi:MAG: SpaA isopeptide-forming pilin-related protein, partial [Tepidisphaeraceae bacterium]